MIDATCLIKLSGSFERRDSTKMFKKRDFKTEDPHHTAAINVK